MSSKGIKSENMAINSISVDNGNAILSPCAPKKQSPVENIKNLLVFGALLFVLAVRGYWSLPESSSQNRDALLSQISKLNRDLESFEKLKKNFVDDEMELSWDRQHVAELEEKLKVMKASFDQLTHHFSDEEKVLREKNQQMRDALKASSKLATDSVKLDHEVIKSIAKELSKTELEYVKEHKENLELKRLLAAKAEEIKQLRGAN